MKKLITMLLFALLAWTVQANTGQTVKNDHYGGFVLKTNQMVYSFESSVTSDATLVVAYVRAESNSSTEVIQFKDPVITTSTYNLNVYYKYVKRCWYPEQSYLKNYNTTTAETRSIQTPKMNSKAYLCSNKA